MISPAGIPSVPVAKTEVDAPAAYQVGPGIIRILSLAPPYLATKDGVKMLSFETEPFLSSGSSSFAMRVQCTSDASILTVFDAHDLLDRALARPEVEPVTVRVTDGADDVARMLLGDLGADRGPLLPRLRNRVAELLHQLLVDVQHLLRQVVLQTDEMAGDGALLRATVPASP